MPPGWMRRRTFSPTVVVAPGPLAAPFSWPNLQGEG